MMKPLILTIDDDPQVLRAIGRDLAAKYGRDYRVVRASSGAEGLDVLRHNRQTTRPVALVLSDQRMPHMDGVTLLAEAKAIVPSAKRALLTAYADTEAAIGAINRSQVDYYLQKPWDPPAERLYPVIDDLLEDWRAGYRPGWEGVRVIGSRWQASAHAIKDFLTRHHVPYEFFDVEAGDDRGAQARELIAGSAPSLPLVILPDGDHLANPSVEELARRVGLQTEARETTYDVAIVGAGPAGLAAAVYAASEGMKTVLIDREAPGGQAGASSLIENYLGFPSGLSGQDLARRALTQARRFEVEVLSPVAVTSLEFEGPFKYLRTGTGHEATGRTFACKALVLAMGVSWQRLPAERAEQFESRGIYYGSATTEAGNCRGEVVYVIGAGNSAGQAALHLAEYARTVVMVVRGPDLGEKMSEYLVRRIRSCADRSDHNIEVLTRTEVVACHGDARLEGLTLRRSDTGATQEVETGFLFAFIGAMPCTEWLGDRIGRDQRGFILTGPDLEGTKHLRGWPLQRPPLLLEASVPGVFAAGDVRHDSVKRVASAVGEGSVSVHFIHRYLAAL